VIEDNYMCFQSYYMPFIRSTDAEDIKKSVLADNESITFILPLLSDPAVRRQMDNILTWDFDVLAIERLTRKKYVILLAAFNCWIYFYSVNITRKADN
jgi:hypothetical protein